MNQQQIRFIESFQAHIPTYENRISSKYDLEQLIQLDDPPKLYEVDIKNLSSIFLNDNPQFQTLVSAVISWNQTAKSYNANPPKSIKKEHDKLWIKNTIYSQLNKILNEIVFTTDRKLQIKMLKNAFDWYYQEIGLKKSRTSSISYGEGSRPTTSMTQRIYREPSFEAGGIRSDHASYENPKVRLKEYSRRLPNYNDVSMSSTTAISFHKMGNFNGGEFSRPQTSPFGDAGSLPNEIPLGRPRTTAGGTRNDEILEGNTINIGNFLSKYPTNGMDSSAQNKALVREVKSSQDQRTKTNKPAFFNRFFNESPEEKKLEDLWYKQRHKALAEKKEDEEIVAFMQEWASNKGRVDEELSRKGETIKYGSEFNEMKYERKKKINLNEEDADLVLHEYPEVENPENEYIKLEKGVDLGKLRVLNEPVEIKGGDEIYVERKKDYIELQNVPIEEEYDKFMTPDKEKTNTKGIGGAQNKKVFDSVQSYNTGTTGLSLEKGTNNQSVFQSIDSVKSKNAENQKIKEEYNLREIKEIDSKIKDARAKATKFNKKRPSTEHEQKRKFVKYSYAPTKDRLIGDICDSPVIKLKNKEKIKEKLEEKNIKIVDFYGNQIQSSKNPLIGYESQIFKQRIKEIRSYCGDYVKDLAISNNPNQENSNVTSLSVYTRPLSHQNAYRKFSNIFSQNLSKEAIRHSQILEIEQIKKRMGKWGLSSSTKSLNSGLMMPLVVLGEKFRIAEHGSTLFENPFNKVEKKKKKPPATAK